MRPLRLAQSFAHRVAFRHRFYRALETFAQSVEDGEPVKPRPERPLIIIGMHRSGTSLLARQMEDLGVFMGKWQGANTNEAMFFRHRNQLLFSLARATWDNPHSFLRAMENPRWRRAFARVAARDLGTLYTLNFLPPSRFARFTAAPHQFWGFKDPRTSLTLPVWNDIFPNAKIINIVRDGNAVAASLRARSKKQLQDGLPTSLVSLDPAMGLSLWADYVLTAREHCASLPEHCYLEIRYEQLVNSPEPVLLDAARFIGVEADSTQVDRAASRVDYVQRPVESNGPFCAKTQRALEMYHYL